MPTKKVKNGTGESTQAPISEADQSTEAPLNEAAESTQAPNVEVPATTLQIIKEEVARIEQEADWSATEHFDAANSQSHLNLYLGLPTALLAAIAGASALSQFENSGWVAGGISIVVTGLAALSTFLNPDEQASRHLNAANSYAALQREARILKSINCAPDSEPDTKKLRDDLDVLIKRLNDLDKSSPQVSDSWRAKWRKKWTKQEEETEKEAAEQKRSEQRIQRIKRKLAEEKEEKKLKSTASQTG
jgi:hypothetical protein